MGSTVTPSQIKSFIIQILALENSSLEDMPDDTLLFEGGLGLDSIDCLELAMALRKHFHLEWAGDVSLQESLKSPLAIAQLISNASKNAEIEPSRD